MYEYVASGVENAPTDFKEVKYILDTIWFIISGCLVMWMAAGFSMLEAGLVRTKNTTAILTKNISLFSLACLMYYVIGYDLMYGDGSTFMGSGMFLSSASNGGYAGMSDFFFQVVFVATAASIVSGTVVNKRSTVIGTNTVTTES